MPEASRNTPGNAARIAAGTLLIMRARAVRAIRGVVAGAILGAAASIAQHDRETARRAGVLTAIVVASRGLAVALAPVITQARQDSREAAANRVRRELTQIGLVVGAHHLGHASERIDEDRVSASLAADGLASGWRSMATAQVLAAVRKDEDPALALSRTRTTMQPSVIRTATTETAVAFADGHRAASRDAILRDPELYRAAEALQIMRQWDCQIEACPRCRVHDGETTGIDDSFIGGDEPGSMHPRCMCVEILVSAVADLSRAA